jgi:hypothetical protein
MSTHRIDRNAKAANRVRRNMQRLAHGAASSTIAVSAPVTSTGGVIGLAFLASTGLTLLNQSLAILQSGASASGYLSSTDWNTFNNKLNGSTALATTSPLTGGGNLSTGLTLSMPQVSSTTNGWLSSTQFNTLSSSASTPIVAADASILVGTSTGSTTLAVREFSTGGISTNASGIGILLGSTSGTATLLNFVASTYPASTNLYTIGGNGSTWWTTTASVPAGYSIASTLNSTCLQTLHNYAQTISTSGSIYAAQYVPALSLSSHYQISALLRNDNGHASGTAAAVGFYFRLPAPGTATSTSGMAVVVFSDVIWIYQNYGTLLASTAVSIGGADHTVTLDVNVNTLTLFVDGVSKFASTSSHDSANSGIGLFAGWDTANTSTGIKSLTVTNNGSAVYPGLKTDSTGLMFLPDPSGGLLVNSTGTGLCCLSTVSADPAVGTLLDGQLWFNTTSHTARYALQSTQAVAFSGQLFINTSDSGTLSNTTTFTPFSTSTSLPAGFFTAGKTIRITAAGQITTGTAQQVTVALLIGGLGLQMPNFVTAGASTLNWELVLTHVCRTAGSTGTCHQIAEGTIEASGATTGAEFVVTNQTGSLDTTVAQNVIAEFAATVANNTSFCRHFQVEVLG